MKTREEIQLSMKESCIASLDSVNKAVVQASVGIGKTRLCLETLAHYNPDKITWLTNSEELRDVDSPAEFVKWDYTYLLEKTTFMCYQTACKMSNQDLGFVIADEFDFGISEQYIKGITQNNFDKFLGVSGTYTEEKLALLRDLDFPLVYEISTNEAQALEILNKTHITFVEFDLETKKERLVKTKDKSWFTSENEQYLYWENQYISHLIKYLSIKKLIDEHYSGVNPIKNFSYDWYKKTRTGHAVKMKYAASQRAKILHTLDSSKKVARALSDSILSNPKNKVIIFSSLTEHLDSYVPYTIHSKNKKGSTVLEDFNAGLIREAGCISMIDRGKNMVGLNNGIFESYDGSETKGTQRLGRLARLMADDTANLYVLVPYYYNKKGQRLPTRAAGWSLSMFSNYELNENNSKTVNVKDLL